LGETEIEEEIKIDKRIEDGSVEQHRQDRLNLARAESSENSSSSNLEEDKLAHINVEPNYVE
jgi:hypothetical protein